MDQKMMWQGKSDISKYYVVDDVASLRICVRGILVRFSFIFKFSKVGHHKWHYSIYLGIRLSEVEASTHIELMLEFRFNLTQTIPGFV